MKKQNSLIAYIVLIFAFIGFSLLTSSLISSCSSKPTTMERTEEYIKEQFNELEIEIKREHNLSLDDALRIFNLYEDSGFEHITENELINAHDVLRHFYGHYWGILNEISEIKFDE